RVAQVVRQRNSLDQVFVEPQRTRDAAPELRHFQRMREAGAEQVALVVEEHLRLVDQAAKRGGMNDAVAVALEGGTRRGLRLEKAAPAAVRGVAGIGREQRAHRGRQLRSITSATTASATGRSTAR